MNFIDIAYASEIGAGAAESSGGVLGDLGINGGMLISQFINFAIIAAVIWWLILKPLTKKMTERQNLIDDSLENAKKIDENLRHSEQKYQAKIDEAKAEASKIIEKSTGEAVVAANQVRAKAKAEIEALALQAKRGLAEERSSMMAELKLQTVELVTMITEKIIKEKLTSEKDKVLISDLAKKIDVNK
ncbi:MAG: F0F1 ATP synthase subunit B [Candidatus Magasanikbacteria bacterium]|nr:F0F1 ATP synthase subunit B [Candidatus Magasanikbacteria bacterium]